MHDHGGKRNVVIFSIVIKIPNTKLICHLNCLKTLFAAFKSRQCRYFISAWVYANAGKWLTNNSVSCTYSQALLLTQEKKGKKWQQNIVLCKICGWERVGEIIPLKPTIPYLHVTSSHSFHFVNLLFFCLFQSSFSWLHLLFRQKCRRERN